MPVVINYKICDLAPECSGIEACPVKAFFWNERSKRPDVDNRKCVSCGLCALECPVGAIMLARSDEEYKTLVERLKIDPRTEAELWRERLGTQPGRTAPLATKVTPENFVKEVSGANGLAAIDVWSEKTLDCRLHSVLWEDLGVVKKVAYKKLDGGRYPKLAERLKVSKFPALLVLKDGKEVWRFEGYVYEKDRSELTEELGKLLSVTGRGN